MTARSLHRIPRRTSRLPHRTEPQKPWWEVLRTEFRDARVYALVGGILEAHRCVASIRPDGWIEFSGPDDETPQKDLVMFNRFPAERIQLVEWLPDSFADQDAPSELLFLDFVRARVEAVVCGRYSALSGSVAERQNGWLDFRPEGAWRKDPGTEPSPEVQWISLPPHAVHRVQFLLDGAA